MRRNHGDWFITSVRPYIMHAALGLRRPWVAFHGGDLAGRIENGRRGRDPVSPRGDVYAETTTGSFPELACVAERLLARPST
jgi:hypothetical protein